VARGIGNRQKRIVTAKKVWVKLSFPLSPRESDGVRGQKKPKDKSDAGRRSRPHPNPLPKGEGT
jgi:hypothetical protein